MWYWLFIKEKTRKFIVLSDDELSLEGRWMLENDGYELISDCHRSRKEGEMYAVQYYGASKLRLQIRPISFKDASQFINRYHRHHVSPQRHKFSIAHWKLLVAVLKKYTIMELVSYMPQLVKSPKRWGTNELLPIP